MLNKSFKNPFSKGLGLVKGQELALDNIYHSLYLARMHTHCQVTN